MAKRTFDLAKSKGARTPSGHLGSAAGQGTGAPGEIPAGKGRNPSPVGGAKTPQGSTRTGG